MVSQAFIGGLAAIPLLLLAPAAAQAQDQTEACTESATENLTEGVSAAFRAKAIKACVAALKKPQKNYSVVCEAQAANLSKEEGAAIVYVCKSAALIISPK